MRKDLCRHKEYDGVNPIMPDITDQDLEMAGIDINRD